MIIAFRIFRRKFFGVNQTHQVIKLYARQRAERKPSEAHTKVLNLNPHTKTKRTMKLASKNEKKKNPSNEERERESRQNNANIHTVRESVGRFPREDSRRGLRVLELGNQR